MYSVYKKKTSVGDYSLPFTGPPQSLLLALCRARIHTESSRQFYLFEFDYYVVGTKSNLIIGLLSKSNLQ